jgi:hypothetical protein
MSPTVFKFKGYRFFFFSREEERMHIHVECSDGEAKFWLVPEIELVQAYGVSQKQIREMQKQIEEHINEIKVHWTQHFRS